MSFSRPVKRPAQRDDDGGMSAAFGIARPRCDVESADAATQTRGFRLSKFLARAATLATDACYRSVTSYVGE